MKKESLDIVPGVKYINVDQCRKRIRVMTPEEKLIYLRQLYIAGQVPEDCAKYFECDLDQIFEALSLLGVKENTRWCSKCETFKETINFSKDKHNRTGYRNWCNKCFNTYRKKDKVKEHIKQVSQEYYLENKEKINQQTAQYYERTKEERKEYYEKYYREHAYEHRARCDGWRIYKKEATPKWVNMEKVRAIYDQAAELTLTTGILHEVDHIIPLRHPLVCGLHVETNLQVLTQIENRKKSNKFQN
jgi:hypothetical protein